MARTAGAAEGVDHVAAGGGERVFVGDDNGGGAAEERGEGVGRFEASGRFEHEELRVARGGEGAVEQLLFCGRVRH